MYNYDKLERLQSNIKIGTRHLVVDNHNDITGFPLHWHNYFEIEYILEGEGKHILNGVTYDIKQGDAYILTPVDFHAIEAISKINLINISFEEYFLPEKTLSWLLEKENARRYNFSGEEAERCLSAIKLLQNESETNGPCQRQLLEYVVSVFLRQENSTASSSKKEHLIGITKAISYMQIHFREKITLEQLATISGYNPTYFSELFRKVTGETYIERLKSLRIKYACMLLSNGISVSDACFASGFGSLSNFLGAFKEKKGKTPSEYKKEHQK